MHTLNRRCGGEISPRIAFTNICPVVSDIYGRLAPLKTGIEIIHMLKFGGIMNQVIDVHRKSCNGVEIEWAMLYCHITNYIHVSWEWVVNGADCSTTGTGIPIYSVEEAWQSSIWQFILVGRSFLFVSDTGVTLQSKVMNTTSQTTCLYIYISIGVFKVAGYTWSFTENRKIETQPLHNTFSYWETLGKETLLKRKSLNHSFSKVILYMLRKYQQSIKLFLESYCSTWN